MQSVSLALTRWKTNNNGKGAMGARVISMEQNHFYRDQNIISISAMSSSGHLVRWCLQRRQMMPAEVVLQHWRAYVHVAPPGSGPGASYAQPSVDKLSPGRPIFGQAFPISWYARCSYFYKQWILREYKAVSETTTSSTATSRSARLPVLNNRQTRAI